MGTPRDADVDVFPSSPLSTRWIWQSCRWAIGPIHLPADIVERIEDVNHLQLGNLSQRT